MRIIDLLVMGISIYSFTFALCILYKISDELDRVNKQINYTSKIKVMLNTFLILCIYPLYVTYRKYVKNNYRGISIVKLYYSIAVLTPELLNIAVSSLIKNQKTVKIKQKARKKMIVSFTFKKPAINMLGILETTFKAFNNNCLKNCY